MTPHDFIAQCRRAQGLDLEGLDELVRRNHADWVNLEPSILGALFEQTLDPAKRSRTGAHYTSREDILALVEPVVMAPLRREWDEVRAECDKLWEQVGKASGKRSAQSPKPSRAVLDFERPLFDFIQRLAAVRILDPACGSGNFLYVSLQLLLDLEKGVIDYGASHGLSMAPRVRPNQLAGLEINPQARELAQLVIWIGYLQWTRHNGLPLPRQPIPRPIESIRLMDAILDLSDPENPREPEWPETDFIVGNPPFLGNRVMAAHFERAYLSALHEVYRKRLGGKPDVCCYWLDKARRQIAAGKCKRAGLLATQGVRGGTNRNVLKRIQQTGAIFFAESDRDWVRNGATVRVSMIGFDDGSQQSRMLDGLAVNQINSNLTAGPDTTLAQKLAANAGIGFQGGIKRGPFDLPEAWAAAVLQASGNPTGKPNSDVVVPYVNGMDLARRRRDTWIIDFGHQLTQLEASRYMAPFEHVERAVLPKRRQARQRKARDAWWLHWCTRPEMKAALAPLARFLATPRVAKHRVFTWLFPPSYADCQLVVFARSDDYFLGVLQSRPHEIWARAQGTQLRDRASGFRYTPTTCFETFCFPTPTDAQEAAIAAAAAELDRLRSKWLNPREWTREEVLEFPGSIDGPWSRYVQQANARGVGLVRYPRIVARHEEHAARLSKRTLTNLYNDRPAWLDRAHRRLDQAVAAAYGWPGKLTNEEVLARLLELNLGRVAGDRVGTNKRPSRLDFGHKLG